MKAIEILGILEMCNALPRGIKVHDGAIFNKSLDNYAKELLFSTARFKEGMNYVEFSERSVSRLMWDRLENCDVEVRFDFGNYRYLVLE